MDKQEHIDYYILSLSQKRVSLFRLHDTASEEICDEVFPMSFQDDYEYSKSSRGTSFGFALKNFEKDKSVVKKERFIHFLREVNKKLGGYLDSDSALLLVGTDEDRTNFKKVSSYNDLITGEISGSFNSNNLGQLRQMAREYLEKNNLN